MVEVSIDSSSMINVIEGSYVSHSPQFRTETFNYSLDTGEFGYFPNHERVRNAPGWGFDAVFLQTEIPGERGLFYRNNLSPIILDNSILTEKGIQGRIERPDNKILKLDWNNGMFMVRDKMPFISWIKRLDGVKIENANLILFGVSYDNLLSVDSRGIAAGYLPIDEYTKGYVISPNYIVYSLVVKNELSPYIYDSYFKRATQGNAPFTQIHRHFY